MARLLTSGFEIAEKGAASSNLVDIDGGSATSADVSLQGTTVRSGALALQRNSGTSVWRTNWGTGLGTADRNYYARVYFRIAGTASATAIVMFFTDSTVANTLCRLLIVSGTNQLRLTTGTGVTIGSDSAALSANTWYMLELA